MPIATDKGTFELIPPGVYTARCWACISLGTQPATKFKAAFKVMLLFELPTELDDEGAPRTKMRWYTLSTNKNSSLSQDMVSWRGRAFTPEEAAAFEVSNVVGVPCQLNIVHSAKENGTMGDEIASITGLPKGSKCPPPFYTPIKYEITDGRNSVFKSLDPKWQEWIERCEEWQTGKPVHPTPAAKTPAPAPAAPDPAPTPEPVEDDVPF